MNASFVGYFAAGNDWQQAALNQPVRFASPAVSSYLQEAFQSELSNFFAPATLMYPAPAVPGLNYSRGYLTNSNVGANQYLFFHKPNADEGLEYYSEATKQPVTVGEALTLGSLAPMNNYKGPVLVITGEYDLPYCGGDCLATGGAAASIPATAAKTFPNASSFEAYIQPKTGHGLNLHYNATAGYNVIQNWLAAHGAPARK